MEFWRRCDITDMANFLIIDDSGTMRKLIRRALRQAGFDVGDVVEAADGAEGLAALASAKPDLVLSDINMPNMNGLEFVKAAREQDAHDPPIVMITTEGSEGFVNTALEYGANGYVRKPFTPDRLRQALEKFLP